VARLEVPAERRRLWWNVESPEQNYGLIAARPASLRRTLDGRGDDWPEDVAPLQAAADEAYLWVKANATWKGHFRLALDTYDVVGRFRTMDSKGRPIDTTVTLPDQVGGGTAKDALDVARQIAASGAFAKCMGRNLINYALADVSAGAAAVPAVGRR